jgi:hypothetical protein
LIACWFFLTEIRSCTSSGDEKIFFYGILVEYIACREEASLESAMISCPLDLCCCWVIKSFENKAAVLVIITDCGGAVA